MNHFVKVNPIKLLRNKASEIAIKMTQDATQDYSIGSNGVINKAGTKSMPSE